MAIYCNLLFKKLFIILLMLTLWLFIPPIIIANQQLPPHTEIWLILSNDIATSLVGIQLIGCDTKTCDHPQLIEEFGQCEVEGCMASSDLAQSWSYEFFNCHENICRLVVYDNIDISYVKLYILTSDKILKSSIIQGNIYTGIYSLAWHIKIEDHKLGVSIDPTYEPMGIPRLFRLFPDVVKFTLAVELAISLLCFQFWLKLPLVQLLRLLLIIALTHLITLPAVWFFFPTLGYFMSGASRIEGGIALSYTLVMFAFLLLASTTPLKFQLISIIGLTVMAYPICFFVFFITTFNNQDFYMTGLSKSSILLGSELFAVVVEATLLTVLSKGVVSKQQAIVLCFITNTASAILGALLLW